MIINLIFLFIYIAAFALSYFGIAPRVEWEVYRALGDGWFGMFMGKVAWWAIMALWLWPGVVLIRRMLWIGYGVSEELGSGGKLKVWKFKSPWLSVTADFATETVRIEAKKATWRDVRNGGNGKNGKGSVNITLPMSGLTHSLRSEEASRLATTRGTVMGMAPTNISGHSIMVSVPVTVDVHNGQSYQYSTGNQILTFDWRNVIKRIDRPTNYTGLVGAGSDAHIRSETTDQYVDINVTLHSTVISKFANPWPKVVNQMKALDEAYEKALLANAQADR